MALPVSLAPFPLLVIVHALAATVWAGGHLVLALGVLPQALRQGSAEPVRRYEQTFEPLGLAALGLQILTGLAMAWILRPGLQGLLPPQGGIEALLLTKLLLLAATLVLALHARLRLIPTLTDARLGPLAWHIRAITLLAVAFVVAGALIRLGGVTALLG